MLCVYVCTHYNDPSHTATFDFELFYLIFLAVFSKKKIRLPVGQFSKTAPFAPIGVSCFSELKNRFSDDEFGGRREGDGEEECTWGRCLSFAANFSLASSTSGRSGGADLNIFPEHFIKLK